MCWKCGENSEDDSDAVSEEVEEENEEIAEPPRRGIIKKQALQNEICTAIDNYRPGEEWPLQTALQNWIQLDVENLPEARNGRQPSLEINKLHGADLATVGTLQRFAQQYGFTVLLATMERFVMVGEYETFDDIVTLGKVYDLSGALLVSDVPTKEDNVLQANVYGDERQPDDTEREDYMGKPGKDTDEFWYQDVVMVLIREDMLVDFLTRCFREKHHTIEYFAERPRGPDAVSLLQALTKQCHAEPEDLVAKQILRDVCDRFLQTNLAQLTEAEEFATRCASDRSSSYWAEMKSEMYYPTFDDSVMGSIVLAASRLKNATMVQQAVRCVSNKLPSNAVHIIGDIMLASNPADREVLLRILKQAVQTCDTFSERYHILCDIIALDNHDDWASESVATVLEDSPNANGHDGFAVYELLKRLPKEHPIQRRIVTAAQRLAPNNGHFIVVLLGSICINHDQTLDHQAAKALYMDLYAPASFDLLVREKPTQNYPARPLSKPEPVRMEHNFGGLLAAIVLYGLRLRSPDVDTNLQQQLKIAPEATAAASPEVFYLPVVRELLPEFGRLGLEDTIRTTLSTMVIYILVELIVRSVPRQPIISGSWGRRGAMAQSAWTIRFESVATKIRELRRDYLRMAVGDQYDRILNLWDVVVDWNRAPAYLQRPPLRELSDTSGNAGAGAKRKAEDTAEWTVPNKRAALVVYLCDCD